MQPLPKASLALAGLGAAALAYGSGYELRSFRLRRVEAPVLAPGQRPLRVLHLSDLHLLPRQHRKIEWVRRLAALEPDLVVDTGDNLAGLDAVPAALDALGPLLEKPGAFVFGSNDYVAPRPRNPAIYFRRNGSSGGRERPPHPGVPLPWPDLRDALVDAGWVDLNNAEGRLVLDGRTVQLRGVNDPHVKLDRYDEVAGPFDAAADLALGVTHAPYRRTLDAMSADGAHLVLAGHTHGGQIRVPLLPQAIVTNCDIPRWQVRGLSRWGGSWLHVSAGLGTSPYHPVRFACPPEATLLTLVPA